jgi:plasmid maintenance system killer protein
MRVSLCDADLAETFRNVRELRKKHEPVRAKKTQQWLKDLEEADTLATMRSAPGRCHELHGDRAGQLSLDLDHPYRLLFRPAGDPDPALDGGLDWSAVRAIVVIGIEDTQR